MPKIEVTINKLTGELQISTNDVDGDLTFAGGVTLTDALRDGVAAALGGELLLKSDVEQHRPEGVKHAHLVNINRSGNR